jgi:hypothetical protein
MTATKEKGSTPAPTAPGPSRALWAMLCLVVTFLLSGTRAEAFFAPPDHAPSVLATAAPESTGEITTAWQYDALDSLIAAKTGQPRGPDGKWTKGDGSPPGASSEQAVWDAVEAKDGWSVTRGRVYTTDGTGQVRVYDGVAHSPRGKNIGLEVKSGTARKTADQRAYDSRVNSGQSTAVGTGANQGLTIDRVKEIRRAAE